MSCKTQTGSLENLQLGSIKESERSSVMPKTTAYRIITAKTADKVTEEVNSLLEAVGSYLAISGLITDFILKQWFKGNTTNRSITRFLSPSRSLTELDMPSTQSVTRWNPSLRR
jgi:hypothetical protein